MGTVNVLMTSTYANFEDDDVSFLFVMVNGTMAL